MNIVLSSISATGTQNKSYSKATLQSKKVRLQKSIEKKTNFALRFCYPPSIKSDTCVVLWDEIEELSSVLHDTKYKIKAMKEYECWDELECRVYDI